jgi:hypothetical protein
MAPTELFYPVDVVSRFLQDTGKFLSDYTGTKNQTTVSSQLLLWEPQISYHLPFSQSYILFSYN